MRAVMSHRGYGREHRRLRAVLAERVERGGVLCARCGKPIVPGSRWALGHDDLDRSRYSGPEHASCNRATSRHRVERERAARPRSRVW